MGGFTSAVVVAVCLCSFGDGARIIRAQSKDPENHSRNAANTFHAKMQAVNQEAPYFPGPHSSVDVGIALSGGGARAMGWAMGVLRALQDLGHMDKVDAISSVSGGTWAAAPYVFADVEAQDLLGRATTPEELTLEVLNARDALLTRTMNFRSRIILTRYANRFSPAEGWARMVGDVFLKPFNLDDRAKYMAGSSEQVTDICARNERLSPNQFVVPRPARPRVLVMNGAVAAPSGFNAANSRQLTGLQMSPDYTGSPFWADYNGTVRRVVFRADGGNQVREVTLGGGMIETFAFGSLSPEAVQSGSQLVEVVPPAEPLALPIAVAISTAAFPPTRTGVRRAVWPILPEGAPKEGAVSHALTDAGFIEFTGMLPLLQRGVSRAVLVSSEVAPLSLNVDLCQERSESEWEALLGGRGGVAGETIPSLFGYNNGSFGFFYGHNQVFSRSAMPPLLCQLQQLKQAGKPTVAMASLRVGANKWWGIKGGFDIKLLVVYMDTCTDFESSLPAETRTDRRFRNHPAYTTDFFQAHPTINLLAGQSEYFIRQNAGVVQDLFSAGSTTS